MKFAVLESGRKDEERYLRSEDGGRVRSNQFVFFAVVNVECGSVGLSGKPAIYEIPKKCSSSEFTILASPRTMTLRESPWAFFADYSYFEA